MTPGVLILFGIGVIGGILSATVVKKLKVPQVLGYILTGIIIGGSGLNIVTSEDIIRLRQFNYFALGIIGFLVGSEISFATFKKYARQFSAILLGEGLLAFTLVCIAVTLVLNRVTGNFQVSLAAGIVFAAIASATDPASTISVLWEYRTAGILTTTIIAIVALDDALAMTLYGIGTSAAQLLSGSGGEIERQIINIGVELFGSIGLGVFAGFIVDRVVRKSSQHEMITAIAIGIILLLIGVCVRYDMDVILAAMAMGITVVNLSPKRSKELINRINAFSTPIYVLFFVLVGSRLTIGKMPGWLWLIVGLYVVLRSTGKMVGAWLGAKISKAEMVVQKYTGLTLFAQGGVAIGLSIMASGHLANVKVAGELALGDVVIFGVTATTFIVQIIGPPLVKLAVSYAGEVGKKVTEEDVIDKLTVGELTSGDVVPVFEDTTVRDVVSLLGESKYGFLPVLDRNGRFIGVVTMNEIRDVLFDQSLWDILVAPDIMESSQEYVRKDQPLREAMKVMDQLQVDQLPVVDTTDKGKFAGILDRKSIRGRVREKLLHTMGGSDKKAISST
ncbi:MAG TPA: CBS domain-containing protein [Candidatus Marinimicrobia bacterium]|nr:CBS domain-containing protein [Candidatus Neomarinimicrobiota bacterium]